MILCIDIGNSHMCGGIFVGDNLLIQFRHDSKQITTSDEFGVFIRSVLRENNIDYKQIQKIGVASVVPSLDYTVRATCIKYLNQKPPLFLQPGIKTGIQVKTHNPKEVGADLIAGAIAATHLYPLNDLLVFDLGTATTACYINKNAQFMGASITPGVRLMMESLHSNTAKLCKVNVNIEKPKFAIGKNTRLSIKSGIYHSQLGFIQQLIHQTKIENQLTKLTVIASGGFSNLFESSQTFSHIIPELVLIGIKKMIELN